MFTALMEKKWFYERLFFGVLITMVKDKKKYSIKVQKIECPSKIVLCITWSGHE